MIEMNNISYAYSNSKNKSLENININIKTGESVAFIGESGCGKTTLTRIINGLAYRFYEGTMEGEIKIDGNCIKCKELYEIGRNVGSIFQNPKSQFFSEIVEDELAFGLENYGIRREYMDSLIDDSLKSINGINLREKNLFHLSSGERQKVAIASINALDPSIYVFDEPSANLDMESVESLRNLMSDIKKMGKTIVVSEHRLYYLTEIIDTYYYLKNGKIINCFRKEDFLSMKKEDFRDMGIRNIALENISISDKKRKIIKYSLEVKNLSFSYKSKNVFKNLSYNFQSGAIYGVIGKNGVGKSTFSKILCGILKEDKGEIRLNNIRLNRKERTEKIYYLTNNSDSNIFGVSIEEEIKLNGYIENIENLISRYNLLELKDRHPMTLSGGQKQRLTIAASEILERKVFIFDEPTSGLDLKNMHLVANRMQDIKDRDKVVIVISHDYEFLMEICTDIIMLEANVISTFNPSKDKENILKILKNENDRLKI